MNATPAPIEHPVAIGEENKRLLDGATRAYSVCLMLAEQGIQVLSLTASWRTPIIRVACHPRLDELFDSAVKCRFLEPRRRNRRTVIRVAKHGGCIIQWRA